MNIVPLKRVLTDEEAATWKNRKVADHQPTPLPLGDSTLVDADTGAPIAVCTSIPEADHHAMRKGITTYRDKFGLVYRSGGMTSKTAPFGYLAPAPQLQRISPTASAWAYNDPTSHAAVAGLAGVARIIFDHIGPDTPVLRNEEARENIHPDWRMGDSCWTSGIVNDTAGLYYHYDRNNTPGTWSAMAVVRAGTRGGHFHIAEYDATLPCQDGALYFFPAMNMMHGVTPIKQSLKGGYRFTAVYYSVKRFQGLPGAAEAVHNAQARQADLEQSLLERQREAGLIT